MHPSIHPRLAALPDRAHPLLVQLGMAALLAAAWAGVVLVKALSPPQPLPWGEALAQFAHVALLYLVIVFTMMSVAAAGLRRLPPAGSTRWLGMAGVVGLCTLCGVLLHTLPAGLPRPASLAQWKALPYLPYLFVREGALALLLVALNEFARHRQQAVQALHQTELRALALQGDLAQAQLNLLQAQIEPHFLFNSLANVRRLLHTDPAGARALLRALRRYLDEALPLLRESRTTLGREAELVSAYLAVHRVRMGARLDAQISVPPTLADRAVPPLMLLTLVENAIKHGLQPLVDGGSIHVEARAEGGRLTLTVADTGRGMGCGMGHGTGLANLQARLKATYGSAAAFSLRLNEPSGVVAEISLPEAAA